MSRPCGCKSYRTCLTCESTHGLSNSNLIADKSQSYNYCPDCRLAFEGWAMDAYKSHPQHPEACLAFPGVTIVLDFLSEDEEARLIANIDSQPWVLSQSGRRKQNYGPKCNFKKRKLKLGDFKGFPKFSQFVQDRFKKVFLLEDFRTIEQCSLEYDPERGASIDPHIDDCWIWGERIVTVNLLADSVLTMTPSMNLNKYNLDCVEDYPLVTRESEDSIKLRRDLVEQREVVRIPMPRRSLLVLDSLARYDWEHRILREDIIKRRVCLAYREFTRPYLPGGAHSDEGQTILEMASQFWS